MAFNDFKKEFQKLEICYLGPDSSVDDLGEDVSDHINSWEGTLLEGSWKKNVNAGGCKNYSCQLAFIFIVHLEIFMAA